MASYEQNAGLHNLSCHYLSEGAMGINVFENKWGTQIAWLPESVLKLRGLAVDWNSPASVL